MSSVIIAIALLCQVHRGTMPDSVKVESACQQRMLQCVDQATFADSGLRHCVALGKVEK